MNFQEGKHMYSVEGTLSANSYSSSAEYTAFWGNSLSPKWFKPKSRISFSYIILGIFVLFIFYLCSQLLFSPSEIVSFFQDQSQAFLEQSAIDELLSETSSE